MNRHGKEPRKQSFNCSVCKTIFKYQLDLTRHEQVHLSNRLILSRQTLPDPTMLIQSDKNFAKSEQYPNTLRLESRRQVKSVQKHSKYEGNQNDAIKSTISTAPPKKDYVVTDAHTNFQIPLYQPEDVFEVREHAQEAQDVFSGNNRDFTSIHSEGKRGPLRISPKQERNIVSSSCTPSQQSLFDLESFNEYAPTHIAKQNEAEKQSSLMLSQTSQDHLEEQNACGVQTENVQTQNTTLKRKLSQCDVCNFSCYDSSEMDLHYMGHFDSDISP